MRFKNLPVGAKPPMKIQPVAPVSHSAAPVAPPKPNASKSSWDKFKSWLKDNRVISGSLGALSRLEILNKYKDYLITGSQVAEKLGYGKGKKNKMRMIKDPNELCSCIHQRGGSWGDFVGWIKDRANDVADVGRKVGRTVADVGRTVYRRAIRPGLEFARDRPLTTLSGIAKVGSYLPIPGVSQALGTASTALGTAGTLLGKGEQQGGARKSHTGRVLAVF